MFIKSIARGQSNACTSSEIACSPNPDPSNTGSDSSWSRPGAHRYIGIGMVAGLILIVFLAWLYCAKWPRACCSRRSKQMNDDDDRLEEGSELGMPAPNISSLEKDKGRLRDSEQGGLVKKVSGGMVVFTQAPKALGAKDRYPLELEMDHVNGIRLETRTPQRHHSRNGSRQS